MCAAFPTRRPRTGGSETRVRRKNGAVRRNGVVNKNCLLRKNDALDSNDVRHNAAAPPQPTRARPNGPSARHMLETGVHYFPKSRERGAAATDHSSGTNMKKRIVRVAALLAMVVGSWIAPQPALAQLGGSLIVAVTAPAPGATVIGTVPVTAS